MVRKVVNYLLVTMLLVMGMFNVGAAAEARKALLVIDIQDAYVKNYQTAGTFITTVNKVIAKASKLNVIPVYICQEGGGAIDQRIQVISENIFQKSAGDAFTNPELNDFLKNNKVEELYVVGLDGVGCVLQTSLGAYKEGYLVTVIKDAIVTVMEGEDNWNKMIKYYKDLNLFLITSDEL